MALHVCLHVWQTGNKLGRKTRAPPTPPPFCTQTQASPSLSSSPFYTLLPSPFPPCVFIQSSGAQTITPLFSFVSVFVSRPSMPRMSTLRPLPLLRPLLLLLILLTAGESFNCLRLQLFDFLLWGDHLTVQL